MILEVVSPVGVHAASLRGRPVAVVHGRRIREGRWDVVLCSCVLVFIDGSFHVPRERPPTERPMLVVLAQTRVLG